ncbi:MAG: hypothetical protein ABIH34_06120 [Nanoarchaeota archaeon]
MKHEILIPRVKPDRAPELVCLIEAYNHALATSEDIPDSMKEAEILQSLEVAAQTGGLQQVYDLNSAHTFKTMTELFNYAHYEQARNMINLLCTKDSAYIFMNEIVKRFDMPLVDMMMEAEIFMTPADIIYELFEIHAPDSVDHADTFYHDDRVVTLLNSSNAPLFAYGIDTKELDPDTKTGNIEIPIDILELHNFERVDLDELINEGFRMHNSKPKPYTLIEATHPGMISLVGGLKDLYATARMVNEMEQTPPPFNPSMN